MFQVYFISYKIKYLFLKPKHASSTKAASPGVMQQYLGSNLGVSHADLASLEHELSARFQKLRVQVAIVGHLERERRTNGQRW